MQLLQCAIVSVQCAAELEPYLTGTTSSACGEKLDHVEKFFKRLQKVFILFHVETNLSNDIACGEKITNMRYGWNMKASKNVHDHGVVVWNHCGVGRGKLSNCGLAGSILAHHSYKSSSRGQQMCQALSFNIFNVHC